MNHARLRAALCASLALVGATQAADVRRIYIVSLAEPAAASFESLAQLGTAKRAAELEPVAISATGARKLDAKSAPVRRYVDFLHERQDLVLDAAATRFKRTLAPKFRYDLVANGFAVELSEAEAEAMKGIDGVVGVRPDFKRHLLTDAGPQWIGADSVWNGTVQGSNIQTRGEGVVVGIVDSGVNTSHPAFADVATDGYNHNNPRSQRYGVCASGADTRCNDKLIGLYDYINETCSFDTTTPAGKDCGGHGTHVASTAVGNPFTVSQAAPTTTLNRTLSGVAPRANVISYKVCFEEQDDGCSGSAIISALNQVVADGVDVVNFSIGGGAYDPWGSVRTNSGADDAAAFFNVRAAGIVPVVAAGNSGPGTSTVSSPGNAPWVITAANESSGRRFSTSVTGISGHGVTTPFNLVGDGITAGVGAAQVVHAKDFGSALCGSGTATNNTTTCTSSASNPFPAGSLAGKIVICDRGDYARIEKGCNVKLAGAVGMIIANVPGGDANVVADGHFLPAVHLNATDGTTIKTLVENARLASGQITAAISSVATRNDGAGDVLNASSGRGPVTPYSGVLKPTLAAPGTSIAAAYHRSNGSVTFSGTSMASPHIAGAAALLLAANPNWSVAQVESALVTTASNTLVMEDGVTDAPYVEGGAGRARVDQAARAGLYFNVTTNQFRAADPSLGGQPKDLNLPFVHTDQCAQSCSFTRSVTAMSSGNWRVETAMPAGSSVTVTPSEFSANNASGTALAITVNINDPALIGSWVDGQIRLVPVGASDVATTVVPVAVKASAGNVPAEIVIETSNTNGFLDYQFNGLVALGDASYSATQLRRIQTTSGTMSRDTTDTEPFDTAGGGMRLALVAPPAAGNNVAAVIAARLPAVTGGDKDLFIGFDANGNGAAEASEVVCTSNSPNANEACTVNVVFPNQNSRYWVVTQKLAGNAESVTTEIYAGVENGAADLGIGFTGPRVTASLAPFSTRISWNIPSLAVGETAGAFLKLGATASRPEGIGRIPLRIRRTGTSAPSPIVMHGLDDSETITLAAGAAHERIVIDVPANATALHVATSGSGEVDLYVAKATEPLSPPTFAAAPPRGLALTSIHPGATEAVDLTTPTLTPGRWYITPVNTGSGAATFTLTSKLDFGAGAVRPVMQSYRNPNRSGHGMFLSQVANVWALVWYTYLEDGTPTWYYAGGTAPSANDGSWRVPLTRYTWNGTPVYSTVGEVILTFDTPTSFTFSWLLNGQYGSEPFSILAPLSCPQNNGSPAQWSGAWYQPGNGGWGFSVTAVSAADAEAVYIFDALGEPRWLLGSVAPAGSTVTIPLSQYTGFCPTCARTTNPTTTPAGTMTRRYTSNGNGSLDINVDYAGTVPGTWVRTNSTQAKITPDIACQ